MKNYITQGEQFMLSHQVEFIPRGIRISPKKRQNDLLGWILLLLILIALIHFVVEPKIPVAHAQTKTEYLSDREQEHEYCTQWLAGEKAVQNASYRQIMEHCKRFGV